MKRSIKGSNPLVHKPKPHQRIRKGALLRVGDHWGTMTLVKSEYVDRPIKTISEGVTEVVVDTRYTIQCKCGVVRMVWAHAFKGKRLMMDCGPDCKWDSRMLNLNLVVSKTLWRKLRLYADERNMTVNAVVVDIIEELDRVGFKWPERRDKSAGKIHPMNKRGEMIEEKEKDFN